jgi:hypothetical protein
MPLSPIGDIASATFNQTTTETLTWETSTDWDNAVSEEYVVHTNDIIELTYGVESWEDLADGDPLPSPWLNDGADPEADTNVSVTDGSVAMLGDATDNSDAGQDRLGIYLDFSDNPAPDRIFWDMRETSDSAGAGVFVLNENGNEILNGGTSNPAWGFNSGDGSTCIESSPSPSYGAFRRFTIDFDWANDQFDLTWEDIQGSSGTQSYTGESFKNSSTGIGRISWGDTRDDIFCGGDPARIGDTWVDRIWGVFNTGSLTTATKSFSSNTQPDLQNLSYTLNSQNVTLDVIGSPGTGSEETVSQVLGGSTNYTLTWSSSHTDFRIQPNLESTDRSTTPTIDRVELVE